MDSLVEDFLAPIVRYIKADARIQALRTLIPPAGSNPVLGPPITILREGEEIVYPGSLDPWVFRSFTRTGKPHVNVEGTGSCAITLEHGTAWAPKQRLKTLEFVTIDVYYHCDPTRDNEIGGPIKYDGRDKCLTLHKEVSRLFNSATAQAGLGFMYWGAKEDGSGALKVVSSEESSGLNINPYFDGDGLVEGMASFSLEIKQ